MRSSRHSFFAVPFLTLVIACGDSGGPGSDPSVATTLLSNSSTSVSAQAGAPVAPPPSVIVTDQDGSTMSGVAVGFVATAGGGGVVGGVATSNGAGIATVGSWTLGAVPGPNTLTATAAGVPALTFSATGVHPCLWTTPVVLGATAFGTLATTDCAFGDGSYIDFYSTSIGSANAFLFRQSSANLDPFLFLVTPNFTPIAFNDDSGFGTLNSAIKILLPSGNYVLGANSYDAGAVGPYAISSATTTNAVTGCEQAWIVRGLTTTQSITAADCVNEAGPYYGDLLWIYLPAGQPVTISESSAAFDTYLVLYDATTGAAVAFNDDALGTNSQLGYTPSASGYYVIFPTTYYTGDTGGYTLTIQ